MKINVWAIIGGIILVLFQVLILKDLHLGGRAFPYIHIFIYPIILLSLPLRTPRVLVILIGFLTGLTIDFFYDSPGVHASALLLMAFFRKFILKYLEPYGGYNLDNKITIRKMGLTWFFLYAGMLMLIFLLMYFSMEAFSFVFIFRILMNTIFSFIFSILLILLIQFLFESK